MKMMITWVCCVLLFCKFSKAQSCIPGQVTTSDRTPLEAVSAAIFKDSSFVGGAISGKDGRFCIPAILLLQTGYSLRLSLVGYQSISHNFIHPDTTFFSHLLLLENKQALSAITIRAQKPLITRKVDRFIINVEGSYLSDGKSALELLRQSPGLWVDGNGSIRIRGSQEVTVMINDVMQRMSSTELAEYLNTLRSEDISTIEVIPNPPGEYEASSTGGIVHIILKKGRRDGLNGAVYARYMQQGKKPYAGGGGSLDFKSGKLYVSAGASFNRDQSKYTGYTNVVYPDGGIFHSPGQRFNNNTRGQYRLGLSYDLSPTQSVTLQTNGSAGALLQQFLSDINYQQQAGVIKGNAKTDWIRHPSLGSTTLSYGWKTDTSGSSLKLVADYTGSSKTETNTLLSRYNDIAKNSYNRTATPSATHIYSLQADYTQTLHAGNSFKTGAKYVATNRHNRVITDRYTRTQWLEDFAGGNDFLYTEKLLMGYLSLEKIIGSNQMKASLRGEQTFARGHSLVSNESITRKYFGLFPAVFINRTLDESKGNSISFNYARRIKRPGYNDLNPYRLQLHDYTILTGNPDLQPQFTHSLELGYILQRNYTATGYFQSAHNFIAQTASTVDSNIIAYQSKNFKNSREYGITLNASNRLSKIWNTTTSLLFYHVQSALLPTVKQTSFSIKSIHTLSIKNIADFDLYAEYNSPYLDANARMAPLFDLDMGITRKIGPHKMRLYLTDVFNTVREKTITRYNNTIIDFYQKRPTRTVSLSFTYNFKRGKTFTQQKLEQAGSEEKARLGS